MRSQAFSNSQAAARCLNKEKGVHGNFESPKNNFQQRLKRLFGFTLLLVLAGSFCTRPSYAEITVPCVEGSGLLALPFGASTTDCAFETGSDTDTFEFTGSAGDEIVLNLRTLTADLDPNLVLRSPLGVEVAISSCVGRNQFNQAVTCGFSMSQTLVTSGTYQVIVGETGSNEIGEYILQLEKLFPPLAPTPLQYDVPVTDTLDPGTDMDFFSFAANAGDEIQLNLRTLTADLDPFLVLRDPNGLQIETVSCSGRNQFNQAITCGVALTQTLSMTGTYSVSLLDSGLNNTGDYNLQLEKLFPTIAPTVLQYDVPVTDTLDPGTDMDFFSFAANAGDEIQLNLRTLTADLDPFLVLRDPNGLQIETVSCSGRNQFNQPITCGVALTQTLSMTGTYSVSLLDSGLNNTGDYNLQLEKLFPTIAPTVLQYDVPVTDTLDPGTDMDFFSFAANAGDEIQLNLRTLTADLDPFLVLRDPNGLQIETVSCSGRNQFNQPITCGVALTQTLSMTGTYSVSLLDSGLNNTGDYNLQLEKLFPTIAPTVLQYDVPVTDTLDPGTDMDFFSFAANAGDEIQLNLRTLTADLDPFLVLRDPNGLQIETVSCSGRNQFNQAITCGVALTQTLSMTGTYSVSLLDSGLNNTGDYNLQLEKLFPTIAPTALQYDVPVTDTLDPGTDMDFFSFAANAGDEIQLNLRTLTADLDPFLVLRDPNGLQIETVSCSGRNQFNQAITCGIALTQTLSMTGTYSVSLLDSGLNNTGDFEVTLECLSIDCGAINEPPVVTNPGPQSSIEGDTVSLGITAADGDTLTYSAIGLPEGLTIDPDTGVISGTLGFDTAGPYDVNVSVADNINDPVTINFAWTVAEGNQPPMLTSPGDQTNNEGDTVALQIIASDDDALTYSASGLPPGLEIDADSGLISGSLDFDSAGDYDVTVTVDDGVNPPVSNAPFVWTVNDVPPPVPNVNVTDLDFGDVIVGASAFGSFEVSNSGGSALVVSDVQSSGLPFDVLTPVSFTVVPAGISQTVNLGFAPTAEGDFVGTITLLSNTGTDVTVNVTGRGIADPGTGDIDTVDSLEFTDVEELVSVEQILTVTNTGDGLLTVIGATTNDLAFEVFTTPGDILPITLNPAETRNLIVRLTPPAGTADTLISAALDITSDDVDETVRTVVLSGSVVAATDVSVNNSLLAAQVDSNLITAATCPSVSGEVQFSSDSSSADNFRIILSHQNGKMVESAFFSAIEGAGVAAFSGIDACGLPDGVIRVLAVLDKAGVVLPAFTGIPAVKNTGLLDPPVLGIVPVFSLSPSVEICGTSRMDTTVRIEGGSSVVSVKLDSTTSDFCLNVPLRRNAQNTLIASAIDDLDAAPKDVATAQPVQIVQVDLANIFIANAFSRPLTVVEIDSLVTEGVIDLNEAENFNVSMFTIVLTIGSFPVTISQPVVVNPVSGTVSYGRFRSGGGGISFGGWSGGGGAPPAAPRSGGCVIGCAQIVVIETESGQTIPGVIIIDGRIKTLKEFFQVGLALFNTTGIFNLSDMNASIDVPGGLTPIRAGIGLDVNDINLDGAVDNVLIGEIAPGETGIAQFLVRGDGIGTHRIDVNFDGAITGGGLPVDIPVSGSARTSVEVLGPPELIVEVSFPANPSGPDVALGEIYTLRVDVTNTSDRPALYTSLELFVGGDALLVDENGNPISDSNRITSFGSIPPNETQSVSFRVKSLAEGEIIACQAVASENIILTIDTGLEGGDCNILNTLPANFVPPPFDVAPTVIAINPLNGEPNIPLTSSVFATFTPQTACLVADTWTNVVTANIDPNDPSKGLKVISADLVEAGTFYLEELDWTGSPVMHVPTDLTVVDPPAGGTTIAVLRLGLDGPHPNSQYFLQSDTAYRTTIIGGIGGVCSAASGQEMNTTFSWIFTTVETCNALEPPSVTMLEPTNGSIDRPLDQQILLEFTNRNKDTGVDSPSRMDANSFVFDTDNFDASSFGVYKNAIETNGDISGGTAVPGAFEFSAADSRLTFVPVPGALLAGDIIHVRITDRLNDVCSNPVQTPPNGVKLFKFDVIVLANVITPNVVGLTQVAAEADIAGAGLTVGTITTANSDTVPAGSVISQTPAGGSSVAPGTAVNLTISLGVADVTVPNVVGLTQSAAEADIAGAGLTVGTITTANSDTVPAGSVISQTPAGGSSVAPGTAVNLTISLGVVNVTVPNVVGLTQSAAEADIVGAGLSVGTITTANSDTVPAGSVISQTPVGGSSVAPGTAVNLTISLGVADVTVPNVVGLTQSAAEAEIVGAGLTVGTITTANSDTVPAGSVISQTPVGGSSVAPGTAVNLTISLGVADVTVPIDIRPFSSSNKIFPRFGLIPVAVFGSETFDPLGIDTSTLEFGPAGTAPWPWFSKIKDINHDGFSDLVVVFRASKSGIQCGDTEATLTGSTSVGSFSGTDSITTVFCH